MSKEKKLKKNPPKKLPTNDIAVLGLVSSMSHMGFFKGITGKQLINEMKISNFPDWVDIKYSTIYNCLSRLEEYGYLKSAEDIDKKSRKRIKLYQITDYGREALLRDIVFLLSTPIKVKSPFDLAIGNLGLLPRDISVEALKSYMNKLDKNIKYLEMYVNGLKNGKPRDIIGRITLVESMMPVLNNVLALFERPYCELIARREWLKEFIQKLDDGKIFTAENLKTGK